MDIVNVIKQNPLPVLGGVIVLIVLMRMGSDSSGNSGGIDVLSLSKVNADANVKLATVNQQMSRDNAAAQTERYKAQTALAATETNAIGSIFSRLLDSKDRATSNIVNAQIATQQYELGVAKVNATREASDNAFSASIANVLGNLQLHANDNATRVQISSDTLHATTQNLPMLLAAQAEQARIQSNAAIETTRLTTAAQRSVADSKSQSSSVDDFGKLIGIGSQLFGFL